MALWAPMAAPRVLALALALGLRVSPTASTMPAIGTWLEPWYTARYNYHWTLAPEPACEGEHVRVLFGDVDGDGRDDLLRAGCGDAGDGWVVAVSNGASGWGAGR